MALNGDLEIGTARFLVFSGKQNERLSIGGKWAVSFAEQNVYSWNARRPVYNLIFWLRRSRSATACCDQTERSVGRSFRASVRASVCPVHCGKTADRIRMRFGIIGRTGLGMRQVAGFGNRSTGRGTFGGEFGARHCNQWGLYGVRVQQCHDAALYPNYFGQTCYSS